MRLCVRSSAAAISSGSGMGGSTSGRRKIADVEGLRLTGGGGETGSPGCV
jgi:hypothetical protein